MTEQSSRPISILLVEDVPDHLELLRLTLENAGAAVTSTWDGEHAWALLTAITPGSTPPDLLITDLRLPGLNGLELIRRVRSAPGLGALPVIAITAEHGTLLERALADGASAALLKPVQAEALLDLIRHVLQGRGNSLSEGLLSRID